MVRFEYSSGVLLFSYRNGKRVFLILKRGRSFDIPKGHIERGESSFTAAIRETEEETGIRAEPDRFFRHMLEYWFYNKGERTKKKAVVFLAEAPKGSKVIVSKEHSEYAWMTIEQCMRRLKYETHKSLISHADTYLNRLELMMRLNKRYAALSKSDGFALSKNLVRGEGPVDAEIMIVGQAPGAKEDIEGRPFIGRAGKLLDRLLHIAGIERERIYITNVVQFFPHSNRIPTKDEIGMCTSFLKEEIEIIKPKLVIALGGVAANALCGIGSIFSNHGRVMSLSIVPEPGIRCFVTLHPAAGVRFKKNIVVLEEDFRKIKEVKNRL